MRRWLGRVGRVLPNLHIRVNDIWVKGGPWHTTVFVQWDATATFAIVPSREGWTAVTTHRDRTDNPNCVKRIEQLQKQLREIYVLAKD